MLKTQRNHLIDLLRFLSASWVFLFHRSVSVAYVDNWYRNFCNLGYLGVPVFFVISGYCICIAYQHDYNPLKFIIRRLFRIFPPYWFSIAVVLACVAIQKICTGTNSIARLPSNPSAIISTLVLYTRPLSNIETINMVYWSLSYEICFYLLLFLVFWLPGSGKPISIILLLALVLLPAKHDGILSIANELPTFTAGYAIFNLLKQKSSKLLMGIIFLLSLTGVYLMHVTPAHLIVVLIVCALLIITYYKPLPQNRLSKLGDISYSIYLLHGPIVIRLLGFIRAPLHSFWLVLTSDIALLLAVMALATLAHKYIELPSINWGRKVAAKIPNKTARGFMETVH